MHIQYYEVKKHNTYYDIGFDIAWFHTKHKTFLQNALWHAQVSVEYVQIYN